MDTLTVKDKIRGLDPELHKSLISALLEKYDNQVAKQKQDDSQNEHDPNAFEKMFRKVVAEIKISYVNGTIDYIHDHHPNLYQKTIEARDKIDEIWKRDYGENTNLDEFKSALAEWKSLHLEAIEIFKEERRRFI